MTELDAAPSDDRTIDLPETGPEPEVAANELPANGGNGNRPGMKGPAVGLPSVV